MARLGDVDGDGCPDYVVGAVHDRSQGWNHGAAYVYSGRTGALIRAHYGRTTFGSDVAGGGDVDGDGIGDVIVGAIQECPQVDCVGGLKNGAVYVFSGATGEQLHKFVGVGPVTTIGTSVDAAGDVDGDGHDDILTGGWTGYGGRGVVMVYSGKTGDRIHTIPGAELTYWLGQDVAGVGDVNGDGHPDFAAGEPRASIGAQLTGRVTVFSGADGSKLWSVHGEAEEQLYRVAGAGDINLDGTPDLIVSSSIGSGNGYRAGMALVLSGVDGTELHRFEGDSPEDYLGSDAAGAGDADGDGYPDLLVGAAGEITEGPNWIGAVHLYSGRTGELLYRIASGDTEQPIGRGMDFVGDLDGDGRDEWVLGGRWASAVHLNDGRVMLYTGSVPFVRLCEPAVPNSTGRPATLVPLGSNLSETDHLLLSGTDLPLDRPGLLLVSDVTGFVPGPGGSQGNLCLTGTIGRFHDAFNTGLTGAFTVILAPSALPLDPPHAVQPGETWTFQAWYRDDNPNPTSNFTDAVSVTFL